MNTFLNLLAVLSFISFAHAGEITETYATGDSVTAATMDNIKAAVNDNAARITTIKAVDGNNVVLGELITVYSNGGKFSVITPQGYIETDVELTPSKNRTVGTIYYLTADCTGVGFSSYPAGMVYFVRKPDLVSAKYYTPENTVPELIAPASWTTRGCTKHRLGFPTNAEWLYPTSPNVPLITGVANEDYILPITFQRQ